MRRARTSGVERCCLQSRPPQSEFRDAEESSKRSRRAPGPRGGPGRPHRRLRAGTAGEPASSSRPSRQVGGLARTEVRDGYRFDLGGHRFFTKSAEVEPLWHEMLGDELRRPRLSRIHWRGRFLDYPLRAGDVVRGLGAAGARAQRAYYAAAGSRPRGEETFEEWVVEPLRPPPVRAVLRLLHGEGVGRAVHRDPRRVGGPADPGPVVRRAAR